MRRCLEYGGHDCVIRAWACDEKGEHAPKSGNRFSKIMLQRKM